MDNGFAFLVEKEDMWAKMLAQVLEDNDIQCVAVPVHGAGLSLKAGLQDQLRIFVPVEKLPQAEELLHELFPADEMQQDQE